MKKLLILSLLLPILAIVAQEFDESFIESLPDDIKEDIMNRSDEQSKAFEDNYRASEYSSRLQQAEELISLKTRLEADLRELEKRLQSDDKLEISPELEIFGSDFFDTFQTSFMPVNEPNPDSTYTLGIGDILNIQITGLNDFDEEIQINGDGSIFIQNIGEVVLAGLTVSEASQIIKSRVNSSFIGAEAYINLSKLRDVNVLVTGNAKNPGIYTLSGNANILQAISVAGGINKFGSFREINLVRNNEIIESLDVYDLLIDAKYNLKNRLRSGDVIFIESRKIVVTIDGAKKTCEI